MPYITITHEAHNAIRAAAHNPDPSFDALPNADGTHTIWLADDTLARLCEIAFPGESCSDTILRGLAFAASHGRAQ